MSTPEQPATPAKRGYTRYGFDALASGEIDAIQVDTANAHRASSAAWAYSKRNGVKLTVSKDKQNPKFTIIRVTPKTPSNEQAQG